MKRLLNALLVITMLFGLTLSVHAIDTPEDIGTITMRKELELDGRNPQETFHFTVSTGRVVEGSGTAPSIADFDITVLAGATSGTFDLVLPNFNQVGVYEYDIQEDAGSTAGMMYDLGIRTLVIQVIHGNDGLIRLPILKLDGIKLEDFIVANNTFNSGDLTFDKVLTGNFGDPNDTFTVTVTLTAHGNKTFNATEMEAMGALGNIAVVDGKVVLTYTVKDGDMFTIQNIPFDVDYAVVETGHDGYNPVYTRIYDGNETGTINTSEITTTITNNRNRNIDTGLNLDNLPYLLALGFAMSGLAYIIVRKKRNN